MFNIDPSRYMAPGGIQRPIYTSMEPPIGYSPVGGQAPSYSSPSPSYSSPSSYPVNPPNPYSVTPSISPNGPTLDDILKNYRIGGGDTFNKGITASNPSTGISPDLQTVLDNIRKNYDYSSAKGMSEAQALAGRRGIGGSSIEQFGTQAANEAAGRVASDASSNVLMQNFQAQQQMKQLQASALFQRAAQEGTLTSDEIASLRNMSFADQQLYLQQKLGEQGLDISRQNIDVARQIAEQQQRNQLLGTGASIFAPYLLGGAPGPGQGGIFSGLFNGGTAGPMGTTPGGSGMFGGMGSLAANPLSAYGNPGGTFGPAAATPGMGLLPGLGLAAGGIYGYQHLPNSGLISKATIAPLVNPLQTAKSIGSKISQTVNNVFPF